MYCSRRGIEVSRPTDACPRCGRCNWEQHREGGRAGGSRLGILGFAGVLLLLALLLMR